MPEVRLINANALHEKIMKDNDNDLSRTENIAQILLRIETAPTIEATLVRHGRWLSYTGTHYTGKENEYGDPEYKEHIFFVCSNCRRKTVVREHFCPNCGVKMDGGDGA